MTGMVWFTADSHFGHKAMAADPETGRAGWRPFATVAEHDEAMIEAWNRRVRPGDQVWHLGDVGLASSTHILGCVDRLHGTKHLITGNHDAVWPGHRKAYLHQKRWLQTFDSVQAFARRRIAGHDVMLSHFPYLGGGDHTGEDRARQYRLIDEGRWLLHGHVHGEWARRGRQLNVGVDVRDWAPISLAEIEDELANAEDESR